MRDALATLGILLLGIGFLIPARGFADDKKSDKTKCSNNLKQIALAAMQYCDDKRFYPHMAKISKLDHDGDTTPAKNDVPPRVMRTLFFYEYLDDPENFVCPASSDKAKELTKDAKDDKKKFGWGGSTPKQSTVNPLWSPDEKDKDADALTDLSYGYTLRAHTANAESTNSLSSDRARQCGPRSKQKIKGNHEKGWNVVCLDAHVEWVKADDEEASKLLSSTSNDEEKRGRALVVWDNANCGDEVKKDDEKKPDEKK